MYTSYLPINNSDILATQTGLELTKRVNCYTPEGRDLVIDKLERLKTENFNRVLVPSFQYYTNECEVTYIVNYIKGYAIGTLVPQYANIVYEDVVQKKSDWTFYDYSTINFIVDVTTEKIYAVDLLSYTNVPNHDDRQSKWDIVRPDEFNKLKSAMNLS